MNGLLRGEILLTIDIIIGLLVAEVIMRLKVSDIIMRRFIPRSIPAVTGLAIAISAGSSKAGAAVLSSSLSRGEISERSAIWSVLMLPLPSYLRRWPSTFMLAVSMAGVAGGVFAASLLLRSIMRFFFALYMLRREGGENSETHELSGARYSVSIWRKMLRTLPTAWLMFGIAYSIVPFADGYFREAFAGTSIGHVSSSLALAGGAIEAGELSVTQGIFALILGSGLGTATRVLRQNAGYYYGLFPKSTATKMLALNLATIIPLIIMNLLFAGLALLLCS